MSIEFPTNEAVAGAAVEAPDSERDPAAEYKRRVEARREGCEGVCEVAQEVINDDSIPETYSHRGAEFPVKTAGDLMIAWAQRRLKRVHEEIEEAKKDTSRVSFERERAAGELEEALAAQRKLIVQYVQARERDGHEHLVELLEKIDPSLRDLYEKAKEKMQQ